MGGSSEAHTVLAETDNTLVVREQLRNCKELAVTENHGQAPGFSCRCFEHCDTTIRTPQALTIPPIIIHKWY